MLLAVGLVIAAFSPLSFGGFGSGDSNAAGVADQAPPVVRADCPPTGVLPDGTHCVLPGTPGAGTDVSTATTPTPPPTGGAPQPPGGQATTPTSPPTTTTPPATATTPTTTTPVKPPVTKRKPAEVKPKPKPKPKVKPKQAKPKPKPQKKKPAISNTAAQSGGTSASTGGIPSLTFSAPAPAHAVPDIEIQNFGIPPFLLPIYQAAGTEYGIPWQVLAAINEIETDYGRNLSVSSAGALGWMQFMPSSWQSYGVDANADGHKDPYNPADAIFAAARYLKAAGGDKDINRAIFAYNHADWYVQSVLLRAKLIGKLPADLVGSLTGLTEGRFPVAARALYPRKSKPGSTAVDITSRPGAPVIAVNDGVIKRVGSSRQRGRYVVLEDAYGNAYTYSHLGKVAPSYPAPKPAPATATKTVSDSESRKDPAPSGPASAGGQRRSARADKARRDQMVAATVSALNNLPVKERLFAHPSRANSFRSGGDQQMLQGGAPVAGYATFDAYVGSVLGLKRSEVVLKPLKAGEKVIAGTILGRIDKLSQASPNMHFEIKPAGRNAPQIDPKPILDGWKLLAATAIYRAGDKNPFFGRKSSNPTIGQVLLMTKSQLEQRVLSDQRIQIYDCGRKDIQAHLIDRRVLAMLEFLAASGLKPYVSTLKCGHSFYVAGGGMISEHVYGDAADIAMINGTPMLGHQGAGSITDTTVRKLLTLQGTMQPNQLITLMNYPGVSYAWAQGDHADHIHVGFQPQFGDIAKLDQQYDSVLKPQQWTTLTNRLNALVNPVVPTAPSKYSLSAKSSSRAG
jgi:murein DD-endopeptidase MepM/ murein hydrolase activator NlpD